MISLRAPYVSPVVKRASAPVVAVGDNPRDGSGEVPEFPYVLLIPAALGGGIAWYLTKSVFWAMNGAIDGAIVGLVALFAYEVHSSGRVG